MTNCETTVIQIGTCEADSLTDNGNCTYTFENSEGDMVTFSGNVVTGASYTDATQTLTLTLCDGSTIATVITCCVDIVDNLDGTYTATFADSSSVVWDTNDIVTTLINNLDGTYTYTNEDGVTTVIDTNETITTLTDNGNGTYTYVSEDSTITIINTNETITTFIDNGDYTYTYTNELAFPTTIIRNRHRYVDETGASFNTAPLPISPATPPAVVNTSDTLREKFDNGYLNWTYNGAIWVLDFEELVTNVGDPLTPTIADFVDDEDPTIAEVEIYITGIVPTPTAGTLAVYTSPLGKYYVWSIDSNGNATLVEAPVSAFVETVTTFVNNGDNTFTYTNESAATSDISVSQHYQTDETPTIFTPSALPANPLTIPPNIVENDTIREQYENAYLNWKYNGTTWDLNFYEIICCPDNALVATDSDFADDEDPTIAEVETYVSGLPTEPDAGTLVTYLSPLSGYFVWSIDGSGNATLIESPSGEGAVSSVTQTVVAGNKIAEHNDGDGTSVDILETITELVDNLDGTFTYTDEDGNDVIISFNNSEISQTVLVGQEIAEHDDGDGNLTSILETITTLVDNLNGTFTFTSENNTQTIIDFNNSIVTQTVLSGNEVAEHDDGDGNLTSILETVTTIVNNGNGTFTFVNESGANIIVDFNNSAISQTVLVGQEIAEHDDGSGNTTSILETITTFVDNLDGTATHTNEAGVQVTIDWNETDTTLIDNGDGTLTYNNEANVDYDIDICDVIAMCSIGALEDVDVTTITPTVGKLLAYDGTDWVPTDPSVSSETTTTIVDNMDGTWTYTNEAAAQVTFGIVTDITNLIAGHLIGTYTAEDGTTYDIDETVTAVTNVIAGNRIGTYTNESGATVDIDETVTTVTNIIAGNRIGTYTNESASAVDIDETITGFNNIVSGHKIADYTDEAGSVIDIDETITTISNLIAGHRIGTYTDEDGTTYDIDETNTTLTYNGDDTYTFVNENGVSETIEDSHHNYDDQTGGDFNTGSPPSVPVNPPSDPQAGETLRVIYDNGYANWSYNGTTWTLEWFEQSGSSGGATCTYLQTVVPTGGTNDVAVDDVITLTFAENIDNSTVASPNIELYDQSGSTVATTNTVVGAVVTITPNADLNEGESYSVYITEDVLDTNADPLCSYGLVTIFKVACPTDTYSTVCSKAEEVFDSFPTGSTLPLTDLKFIRFGQEGDDITAAGEISVPSTSATVPQGQNGDLFFLQVMITSDSCLTGSAPTVAHGTNNNLANLTLLWSETEIESSENSAAALYAADVNSTANGGDVDITWPVTSGTCDDGVVMWKWYVDRSGVQVADLDTANLDEEVTQPATGNYLYESGTLTPDACPGYLFTFARNAGHQQGFSGSSNFDGSETDWFSLSNKNAGNPVSATVSRNCDSCGVCGLGAAWIAPNASPFTVLYRSNYSSSTTGRGAAYVYIPIDCEATVDDTTQASACVLSVDNDTCEEKQVNVLIQAGVDLLVDIGDIVEIIPVLDGTQFPEYSIKIDNSDGVHVVKESLPITIMQNIGTVAPLTTTPSVTCRFDIVAVNVLSELTEVVLKDWVAEMTLNN